MSPKQYDPIQLPKRSKSLLMIILLVSVLSVALSAKGSALAYPVVGSSKPVAQAIESQIFIEDFGTNTYRAYTDRIDWNIYTQTLTNLPTSGGAHREPRIAPDGYGGIYVVWADLRNNQSNGDWDIYAQHMDSEGNRLWPQDRRVNSDSAGAFQGIPLVTVDSQGNALFAWIDDREEPASKGIYAQRIASDGTKLWSEDARLNGVDSYRVGWGIDSMAMGIDSQDCLVVAWQGIRDGNWSDQDIHMQKLDVDGRRQWTKDVQVHLDVGHRQTSLALDITNHDEIIVVWIDERNGGQDIYAQWLSPDGIPMWQEDVSISSGQGIQFQGNPNVVADNNGNAVVVWRSGPEDPPLDGGESLIFAQQIGRDGSLQWPDNMRVNDDISAIFRGHPRTALVSNNQVLVIWEDTRRGFELGTVDVYAQLLSSNGSRQWTGDQQINPEDWRNWNIKPSIGISGNVGWIVWNTDDDVYIQAFDLDIFQIKLPLPSLANDADGKIDQVSPDISRLDQNRYLIVWEEVARDNWDIRAQIVNLDGQTTWPTGILVNDFDIAMKRQQLRVATNNTMRSLLVWHDEQGGIYGQMITEFGIRLWDHDLRFDQSAERAYNPAVKALENGNFAVAWLEERETDSHLWDVYLQIVDTSGNLLGPINSEANSETYSISEMDARSSVEVAEDSTGHVIVAWRGEMDGNTDVFMRRFTAAGIPVWSGDIAVNAQLVTLNGRFQDRAFSIVADDEITVASSSLRMGQYGIFLQRLNLEGHHLWSPGVWVSNYPTRTFLGNASLTTTDNGDVIVVWDEEPSLRDAYAQRVGPLGELRWPTKIRLNQTLTWPLRPRVSPEAGNSFLSVWHDERLGDNTIYTRRFYGDGQIAWENDAVPGAEEFFYHRTGQAESKSIALSPVTTVKLLVDQTLNGGNARYYLSNNGSRTWEEVVPGLSHRFSTLGSDLRWRIVLQSSSDKSRTPVIREIRIQYGSADTLDPYEPDDACSQANAIAPDGSFQQHSFHLAEDTDWVRFSAIADTRYAINAVHIGDFADVEIEIYDTCINSIPIAGSDDFGKNTTVIWTAPIDGLYYLRLVNHNSSTAGFGTDYRINVRPVTIGAAILAGGRLRSPEDLQEQITFMTEHAYRVFKAAGYTDDAIYYLSADPSGPSHIDAPSYPLTLEYAIQIWAPQQVDDGEPLYIYLADHGAKDVFYMDTSTYTITPEVLDQWLKAFENQRPSSPVIVIIEACLSGSFISPPYSLSKSNRIIVTSADDSSNSIAKQKGEGGTYFSDPFFDALSANLDLWSSFETALEASHNIQSPWIDGNGNGVPYPADPADEGAGHNLGLGRKPNFSGQAPYIESSTVLPVYGNVASPIRVTVLDEDIPRVKLWVEITKPSTPPPSAPPGYITPIDHAQRVDLTYNPTIDRFEAEFIFNERGLYQFIFQAEDAGGQRAQPVMMDITSGDLLFLPSIFL